MAQWEVSNKPWLMCSLPEWLLDFVTDPASQPTSLQFATCPASKSLPKVPSFQSATQLVSIPYASLQSSSQSAHLPPASILPANLLSANIQAASFQQASFQPELQFIRLGFLSLQL